MTDEEVKMDISEPDFQATVVMEDHKQQHQKSANRLVAEAIAKKQAEGIGEMTDEEVKTDVLEPVCESAVVMEDSKQQHQKSANRLVAEAIAKAEAERISVESVASVTATDTSLQAVDQSTEAAGDEGTAVTVSAATSSSVTANSDSVQQTVLSAVPGQSVQVIGMSVDQSTSTISSSVCQPLRIVSAVSSIGQISGVSKSPAFVLCQTSGGQTILVPRSAVSGIQLSSGAATSSTTSVTQVPVFRSAVPLRAVSSNTQGIVTATSASSSAAAVVVSQTSGGVHLLRQAADGVRVIAGTNSAANRATLGVMLNRGTAPQRLAVAITPANNALRPAGAGSIRLVAIRNGTPVAIGGVVSSGSAAAPQQLKLLTPAVTLSGVRPLTATTTGVTTATSSVAASASNVSAVRQQTAVNDVQAYLRRIEELRSSQQPDQGAKTPVTLAAAVRAPLKAKTVLPSLTSAQQIVVLQSGSQPQLANISASQLVSMFVITYTYYLL